LHPIKFLPLLIPRRLKQLLKEGDQLWANSIFDLLGQAAADDAFRDFKTIDDVLALQANPKKLRRIYWKEQLLQKYILRSADGGGLSTGVFTNKFREYCKEEGYGRVTSYAVRRYASSKVAGK
jgi:hypothetical protein